MRPPFQGSGYFGMETQGDALGCCMSPRWSSLRFADRVREVTGGIPIGMKMSANHIEADLQFSLDASVDYIILDGRGGGTGAAPLIFRDHISVPTIPALARARRHLDASDAGGVTLIITGGLRHPADFAKAMALGADGVLAPRVPQDEVHLARVAVVTVGADHQIVALLGHGIHRTAGDLGDLDDEQLARVVVHLALAEAEGFPSRHLGEAQQHIDDLVQITGPGVGAIKMLSNPVGREEQVVHGGDPAQFV